MNRHVFRHDGECGLAQEVVDVLPLMPLLHNIASIVGMAGQPFRIGPLRCQGSLAARVVRRLCSCLHLAFSVARGHELTRRLCGLRCAGTLQAAAFVKLIGVVMS
jgi:hypothetical protein